MTRIASKFGIAAALTIGMISTAAAQRTTSPTTTVGVSKGEVAPRVDTVTVMRYDTVRVYRTDTVTVTGPTVTQYDSVTVLQVPGWLDRGNGLYFGLGGGAMFPSAGIGQGQIPGYTVQANLGVDPAGSPLGFRLTANLARPDEAQPYGNLGPRPTIWNFTGDLKLRMPWFGTTDRWNLYGIGGLAYIMHQGLREQSTEGPTGSDVVVRSAGYHDTFGYTVGGGLEFNVGHKRNLFVEGRVINFNKSGYEGAHQAPFIVGLNWY